MTEKASDQKTLSEVLTLRAIIVSLALILIGLGSLTLSANFEASHWLIRASVFREVGAFALVSWVLAVWWEIIGRRSFSNELLRKVGIARTLEIVGITKVTMDFRDTEIDWNSMFASSSRLDIWVSYGSTWRNSHITQITQFLQQEGNLLQIAIPNPDDASLIQTLSSRFSMEPQDLSNRIRDTIRAYQDLATAPGKVKIYLASSAPIFTFYRFNNFAVVAFYNHRRGRSPVPAFVCSKNGLFYQYIVEEFAFLASGEPLAAE